MMPAVKSIGFREVFSMLLLLRLGVVVALWLLTVQGCSIALAAPRNPRPTFNVLNYNAVPDDGVDDTARIQAAINGAAAWTAANPNSRAEVIVPEGTFRITTPLLVTGDRITISGGGTVQTNSGNATMTSMIDATGDYFTCYGITIDGNDAGFGDGSHCLRVQGTNNLIDRVTCKNALDTGFQVHTGSLHTRIVNCISDSCHLGLRVGGDYCTVRGLDVLDFDAQKGIIVDPQIFDAQYFSMEDVLLETNNDDWECFVLIDTGDGGAFNNPDGTQKIDCDAAANVGGKAQYTIAAGHGYRPGDGFRITDSGNPDDGFGASWDRCHVIANATGNVYVRRLSDTTFALYDTPQNARNTDSTTGRLDIQSDVSATAGVNFYVTTSRGGVQTVAVNTLDYVNDVFTTSTSHNFQTCELARITPHSRLHVMPLGIRDGGKITLEQDYEEAGSASTCYFRPKRLEFCRVSNVRCVAPNIALNTGNCIKVHNCNTLVIEGSKFDNPLNTTVDDPNGPGTADDEYWEIQSLRIGAHIRSATFRSVQLSNGLRINPLSRIGTLVVDQCAFGDGSNLPVYAVEGYSVGSGVFRNTVFRCNLAGINYDMRDAELEWFELDNCRFETYRTSAVSALLSPSSPVGTDYAQVRTGGKFFFRPNCKYINPVYPGMSVSSFNNTTDVVTMSTVPALPMGAEIYFTTTGSMPSGVTQNQRYFWRPTGNTTGTLHNTRAASQSASSTPVDVGTGASSCLMHSCNAQLGTTPTASGVTNLLARCQGSPRDLQDVVATNATATTLQLPAGTRIWNPNAGPDDSPGWVVTAEGVKDSTGNTLTAMPALTNVNALFASVDEASNVSTTETDLISYTLPANTLGAVGDSVTIEAGFSFAANAATKTIKLYLGSSDLMALSGAAQNSGKYVVRAVVIRDSVNTAKVSVVGGTHGGSGTPLGNIAGNNFTHSADLSTALTIKGTGQSNSAGGDATMEYLRVTRTPAPQ